jgi:peptidoglycan-N-acetylglucosamine deacetylase
MYLVRPPYLLKSFYPHLIWRKNQSEKKLYLSFDDGPIPKATDFVLDILKEYNIKATFFCVGENIERYPQIFNSILSANHRIGNHTYQHLNGWNTSSMTYLKNYKKCEAIIKNHYSGQQKPLFRPPYGRMKKKQALLIQKQSDIIMWDVLSGDFDRNITPQQCLDNVMQHIRNGSIIVFHDSEKAFENMSYALPRFIEQALEQDYTFDVL